jgi:integrase
MLSFLIFTACRTNEVVEARWSEIDRPSSTWKIPGERMKMHQDHVVPLSDPALAILDKMRDGTQGELIFANPDDGVFSENAMLAVLDRLGHPSEAEGEGAKMLRARDLLVDCPPRPVDPNSASCGGERDDDR